MPLPSPVRPWHGEQKTLKRSWPRAITSARHRHREHVGQLPVDLAGVQVLVFAQLAAGDGVGHRHARRRGRRRRTCSPRAARSAARRACPGGTPPPRHDARRRQLHAQMHSRRRADADLDSLRRNFGHSYRMQAFEELPVPSRSNRGSIASMQRKNRSRRRARERRNVEHRVIRLRQPVQRPHADKRGQRRAEHGRLEGHRDELRPAVERPAADVHRVGDRLRQYSRPIAAEAAERCRRASTSIGRRVRRRPSASSSSSIGIGE